MSGQENKSSGGARTGPAIIGAGCLFGLAPMIVSIVALFFGSSIGNVLHWYTLITLPIGLCIAVVGIVLTASRSAKNHETTPTRSAVPLDASLRDSIRLRFLGGSLTALTASIVAFVGAGAGDPYIFGSLITAALAVWVGLRARKVSTTANLEDFRDAQLVASVLIIIGNLGTVLSMAISLIGFLDGLDYYEWSAGQIASLVSALALTALAITSIIYTERITRRLRVSSNT